jgi:alpha-beta hydrolase superfamily lysophospholipase
MADQYYTLFSPDGQQLYGQGWPCDQKPKAVVCVVHGLGEHCGRYAHVAEALNAACYAVLAYDQRGHGQTAGQRGHAPSFDTLLDDVSLLLAEAANCYPGLPRFLYGHSMGGNVVLRHAMTRRPQIAGVIATSPALGANKTPLPTRVIGRIMYRVKPTFSLSNGLDQAGLSHDPRVIDDYQGDPLVHDRVSARFGLDLLDSMAWVSAHAAEFPPIPLLLVHGTDDRITSPAATQAFASQVKGEHELKLWDGLYHETHNEPERDVVLRYLIDWLDRRVRVPVRA